MLSRWIVRLIWVGLLACSVVTQAGCTCYSRESPLQWTTTRETVAGVPFERLESRPTTEAEHRASRVCEVLPPSPPPVVRIIR